MPHTTDRRRVAARRRLTGEPPRFAAAGLPERGQRVRVSERQQILQVVLLESFTGPQGRNAWDPRGGRTLADLFNYWNWVSPQPDRLIIACSAPERVAAYLLPYTGSIGEDPRNCAGIPGLRVETLTRASVLLRHLPTGGTLEVTDWEPRFSESTFQYEVSHRRSEEERYLEAAWRSSDLTAEEATWQSAWHKTPCDPLLSTLMGALSTLTSQQSDGDSLRRIAELAAAQPPLETRSLSQAPVPRCASELELARDARSSPTSSFSWIGGIPADRLADILTGEEIGTDGAVISKACKHVAVVTKGSAALVLRRLAGRPYWATDRPRRDASRSLDATCPSCG